MRAQSAAASSAAIIRARPAIRASDSGALKIVLKLQAGETNAGRKLRKRHGHLAAQPPGCPGQKQRAEEVWQPRVDLVPPAQMPARPRRGRQHERARSFRMRRGETPGDQATERDTAHNRPIDPALIERGAHLIDVGAEATARIEREPGGRFIAQRKRDDAESGRQRVDRGSMLLPATLSAWNQHQRRASALFDDVHRDQFLNIFPVFRVY